MIIRIQLAGSGTAGTTGSVTSGTVGTIPGSVGTTPGPLGTMSGVGLIPVPGTDVLVSTGPD
ncbi:hypothetical protein GCM10010833_33750 [Blastomonas aquatica]|uniref:Uncharacterized protein n=1 Tax=Blastomonas aquatica TaxID=1510276 RepID=A0ABQ1JUP8_9SPHN|nr:hypothetical protein GCM10010833_33750 [Blastomonas aquatica]